MVFAHRMLASFPWLVCCNFHVANGQHAVLWFGSMPRCWMVWLALVWCETVFMSVFATSPRMLHKVIVYLWITACNFHCRGVACRLLCHHLSANHRWHKATRDRHKTETPRELLPLELPSTQNIAPAVQSSKVEQSCMTSFVFHAVEWLLPLVWSRKEAVFSSRPWLWVRLA